jgi:autotransporter-like protein
MTARHLILAFALWPAGASAADWSASLSGGIATVAGEGGQPFLSATLTRYFGAGFVRAGLAWFDGEGDPDVAVPLPARTRQLTVGGGYQAGRVLLDAYATVGRRDFIPPGPARTGGRIVRDDTEGSLVTLGGSAAWDVPAGDDWSIAPSLSLSYSAVDSARTVVPAAGDPVVVESRENGWTGIAAFSAERVWPGASLGIYLAAAATSNRATINRQGSGLTAARAPQLVAADEEDDAWAEYGVTGEVRLSPDVSLDMVVVRTVGFSLGETTSASAGVRVRF